MKDLDGLAAGYETMSRKELAKFLAESVDKRVLLLKIMSMNHYDMEANSRMVRLVEFKRAYGASIKAVNWLLKKFCPEMTEGERQDFLYTFFPFMYGIYPYTVVTDKQREAMEQADVGFVYFPVYEMTYTCVKKLLGI